MTIEMITCERATWIASHWQAGQDPDLPHRTRPRRTRLTAHHPPVEQRTRRSSCGVLLHRPIGAEARHALRRREPSPSRHRRTDDRPARRASPSPRCHGALHLGHTHEKHRRGLPTRRSRDQPLAGSSPARSRARRHPPHPDPVRRTDPALPHGAPSVRCDSGQHQTAGRRPCVVLWVDAEPSDRGAAGRGVRAHRLARPTGFGRHSAANVSPAGLRAGKRGTRGDRDRKAPE